MAKLNQTALVTGASSGIGAVYADRLARRGYDLILVARDEARLAALADRLETSYGIRADLLKADLTSRADLARVENRLRDDASISLLVNNAGAASKGGFLAEDLEPLYDLVDLNVGALTRLAGAAVQGFLARGKGGSIINIGSVVGLAPEWFPGVYGATKAFVLALSQAMQGELAAKDIYVQAVLPAATRTEIWQRSGRDVDTMTGVMPVDELVDAALVGFDRREGVTIPPLPDEAQWQAFQAARLAMLPNFSQEHPAVRYRD
ncbi:hypothetical protein sos41_07950 [Alphaproteobacteria bacterium SO-S41]|nr:hypothetical protein sos41_07950 [Alphaproteobacteria bacterium SO-S41]